MANSPAVPFNYSRSISGKNSCISITRYQNIKSVLCKWDELSSCDHLLCHINFQAFVNLLPKSTPPVSDGRWCRYFSTRFWAFNLRNVQGMPTSSVRRWFFTPSPWSFLVVSRPGLGIAPFGRFVGFRAFPGLLKESSYSVRMFAIVFIGLSAQTGSFQWQPVKGSFTHWGFRREMETIRCGG